MKSQVNEINPTLVELKVEIPWSHVQEHLDAEYKKVMRTARVKGFRPGKAPLGVVKRVYGPQVEAEVANQLVQEGINSAIDEHSIPLVAQPQLGDFTRFKKDEPFTFDAKVEVRPKIGELDLEGIEVYSDYEPVEESAIEAEIEQLRVRHSDIITPEPARPAKDGDLLTLDFKILVEGEPEPDLDAEDSQITLGEGNLLPELDAGIKGMSVGETKDIEITFPEDHPTERFQNKKITFKATLKELKERVLPEVDDEFAKDCEFDTLDALKANIRERLEQRAKAQSEASIKNQLVDALIDKNDIPVPPTMLKEQQQQMLYELFQLSQMMGQTPDFERLMSDSEHRAPRRVKGGLLLQALAEQQSISISEEDLEAKFAEIAESTGKHIAKVRADYRDEKRAQLENELIEDRLLGFLREKAKIIDGKRPAPAEEAEKAEESEES